MTTDLTTLQLRKSTKKRFKKLLMQDRKKRQERHFYSDDFLVRLLDIYEQTDGKYEH